MNSKLEHLRGQLASEQQKRARKPLTAKAATYACKAFAQSAPAATGAALCDWAAAQQGTTLHALMGDYESIERLAPGLMRHPGLQLVSRSEARGTIVAQRTRNDAGRWAWSIIGEYNDRYHAMRWNGQLVDGYRRMLEILSRAAEKEAA